ncbi:uncharacterized protein LOC142616324 [Castanea sativa]|uniref:uncharacterized protein LOC142616324 n=1 Tax=Castanea sativa TaxID=21020 RepID=UPI003F651143
MKLQVDKHRSDRVFEVSDWVYLRLQPFKQKSLAHRASHKLSLRFYGPFQVLQRIGAAAYKLQLPPESRIHLVFHVSCLKKQLGQHILSIPILPSVNDVGVLNPEPVAILDSKEHNLRSRVITELLVQWQGGFVEHATWESLQSLSTVPSPCGQGVLRRGYC